MYHTIEFIVESMISLEISPKHWLEKVRIEKGTHLLAQIKPYIVEGEDGPVEVADLYLDDGTVTRQVPFANFRFVD
jgi:hypothetical protein